MPFKSLRLSKRREHSVRPLQRLFKYGHQYIKQIRLAIGASILNKVFDLAPPVLIGIAVDVVVKQQDSIPHSAPQTVPEGNYGDKKSKLA